MEKAEILIREVRAEDSDAIATILRAQGWFEHIQAQTPSQTQERVARMIEIAMHEGTHTILVAQRQNGEEAGHIAGYVAVHWFPNLMRGSCDGYISELFVLPADTGQGIGSRLLESVHAHALERGCAHLLLMNRRIRESYRRGFYTRHGWKESPDGAFFMRTVPNS